jgi:tight adherence protein B
MFITILFIVLALVCFAVVLFATKPTKLQAQLDKRLSKITQLDSEGRDDRGADEDILKRTNYSDVAVVNSFLQGSGIAERIHRLIEQSDLSWTVGRLIALSLVLLCFGAWIAALWLHNVMLGLAAGVGASVLPFAYVFLKRAARLRRFGELLPEAIDLMSRALRAGHAVSAAIEMVAREIPDPVGGAFRRASEEQSYGLPLREALINLALRVPLNDVKFLVTAMLVQKETGGNLAEVLDKTAVVIRERARLLGQLRIYTAQGRLTGWILGLLPFMMFFMLRALNPAYTSVLLETPVGLKLVWAGLGLMILGIWVIRRIVEIKV